MIKKTFIILLVVFLQVLFISKIYSQICTPDTTYTCSKICSHVICNLPIPEIVLPEVNNSALILSDSSIGKSYRYGITLPVDLSLENTGRWDTLENEQRLWRLKITSKNAFSLQLYFNMFWIPSGAKFFIYNSYRSSIIGAITSKNNKEHLKFATQPIAGESITIEYLVPGNYDFNGVISINEVGHAYRNIFNKDHYIHFGTSGNCNFNVNCPEGDNMENQKHSVALISVLEDNTSVPSSTNHYTAVCSGSMINNTKQDGTPYFLTAFHCLDNDKDCNLSTSEISNSDQWVFIFNYESEQCSNPSIQPNTSQSASGAVLIGDIWASDAVLLKLQEIPTIDYNVFLAGWDIGNIIPVIPVAGIHHPSGDIKKISSSSSIQTSDIDVKPQGACLLPKEHTWKVIWESGITEGGSSGSPLFNNEGRIVGQLKGGSSNCTNPSEPDYYGKLSSTYNNSFAISQTLNPAEVSYTSDILDGIYLKDTPVITCNDGILNGDETDVDCGGSCPIVCGSCEDIMKNPYFDLYKPDGCNNKSKGCTCCDPNKVYKGKIWDNDDHEIFIETSITIQKDDDGNFSKVINNSNVKLFAAEYIELTDFEVEEGSNFEASATGLYCNIPHPCLLQNFNLSRCKTSSSFLQNNNKSDSLNVYKGSHTDSTKNNFTSQYSIAPNPSNGKFIITILPFETQVGDKSNYRISIYNFLGQKIYEFLDVHEKNKVIDISNHQAGIYFIEINNNEKIILNKIIIF